MSSNKNLFFKICSETETNLQVRRTGKGSDSSLFLFSSPTHKNFPVSPYIRKLKILYLRLYLQIIFILFNSFSPFRSPPKFPHFSSEFLSLLFGPVTFNFLVFIISIPFFSSFTFQKFLLLLSKFPVPLTMLY